MERSPLHVTERRDSLEPLRAPYLAQCTPYCETSVGAVRYQERRRKVVQSACARAVFKRSCPSTRALRGPRQVLRVRIESTLLFAAAPLDGRAYSSSSLSLMSSLMLSMS